MGGNSRKAEEEEVEVEAMQELGPVETELDPEVSKGKREESEKAPPPRRRLGSTLSRFSLISELPFLHHHHHYVITSRAIIRAASVIGWNASFMFISECVIEILMLAGVLQKIPFRLDFFALTTISALLGYQTLVGVAKKELDVTRNSLILAFMVESFLVGGDVEFLIKQNAFENRDNLVLAIRFPFVVLTAINLFLVIWMYLKLHHSFKPDWPVLMDILFLRKEVRYASTRNKKQTADENADAAEEDDDGSNII